MERILLVEDDESIKRELTMLLRANGYGVVEEPPCDLALLDINLPGESGYAICRRLREQSDVPVIFLTARDSAEDEILGFGVGADDYIRKPYNSSVLLARIARLLKRKDNTTVSAADLTLDLSELRVFYGEKSAELTKNETRILYCLMKQDLCTKEEIIGELWNNSLYVDENTLYVNISRLREKLKEMGAKDHIRTVRGVGVPAMRLGEYIRWKAITLCFIGIGIVLLGTFLLLLDSDWQQILVAEFLALLLTLFWLLWGYFQERNRLRMLERIVRELEEPHLLGEVLPRPASSMERKYYDVMKEVSRSAIGAVEDARWEAEAYRDYVERWVHEIKTPLTACSLILDNDGDVRKLRRELKRADNLAESILYYARMATIEKDTRIRRVSVAGIMEDAVKSQMEILIGAGISIEVTGDFQVPTDDKSLLFILKQLLINCGKYCPGGHVVMKAEDGRITVEDNGPGIPSHELRRVTDRGFSGANGRASGTSTGMGLYIVKELCRQLGIGLEIQSEAGVYTRVRLSFGKEAGDVVY